MPYIIAEIGINFDGKLSKAIKLIKLAKRSGVNAVKFQIFNPKTLARKKSKKTFDQKKRTKSNESLYNMWKRMEIDCQKLILLKKESEKQKLDFICSVFDMESLKKITKHVDIIKIASSEITDLDLLKKISQTKKKIIISTGMATITEIYKAIRIFKGRDITLLHCVSLYPCPDKLTNLNRMSLLKKIFNVKTGYSDHTIGNDACIAAISMGAEVIEKHFTDNKKLKGADHSISANKEDMRKIVNFSNKIKEIKGTGNIEPSRIEKSMRLFFRKSIYYSQNLKKGMNLKINNIYFARPFHFFNPAEKSKILGKKLKKDVTADDPIKFKDIF